VRCLLAAVTLSVINKMTSRLGYGWTYVLLGGTCILTVPLMYLVMKMGPKWRRRRELKEEAEEEANPPAETESPTAVANETT
jgi:hypothetical protein